MGDRPLIYTGLFLFLLLVTFPVWKGLAAGTTTEGPEVRKAASGKECVAPREYMRTSHMDLLLNWRDDKVREGRYRHTSADGRIFTISLRGTCLDQCHGSREKFCDSCHSYAGVPNPGCWSCHPTPPAEGISAAVQRGSRI